MDAVYSRAAMGRTAVALATDRVTRDWQLSTFPNESSNRRSSSCIKPCIAMRENAGAAQFRYPLAYAEKINPMGWMLQQDQLTHVPETNT